MNSRNDFNFFSERKSKYRFGEFEILKLIKSGKIANLYQVEQNGITYALKRQKSKYNKNAGIKISNEALILSRVGNNQYFPRMISSGNLGGYQYILMEFISGVSLKDALFFGFRTHLRLDHFLACWVTAEICRGLECLHALEASSGEGLIHGDIKPENIMISDEGEIKLIDLTLTGLTKQYAPDERLKKNTSTQYSDIYATGHVLYELLHGRHLSRQESQILFKKDLPEKIQEMLVKSLEQGSSKQYQNINEFLADLEIFLRESQTGFDKNTLYDWLKHCKMSPQLIKITKRGHLLKTDAEGFLVNECSIKKIESYWLDAANDIKEAYLKYLPKSIHSIYLRGSVPRGEGIEEVSDIDSFAVIHEDPKNLDLGWIEAFEKAFHEKYPFCSYVEIRLVPYDKILNDPAFLVYRFIIKVLSVCIYGSDLSSSLPKFKPSLGIAFAFHGNILDVLNKAAEEIRKQKDSQQVLYWCQWVMKRILRTGFGLVMEKEQGYTRDLYPCYENFCKYYPEQEPQMRQTLEWAIAPSGDKDKILEFLNSFGTWMASEAQRVFSKRN